jgi:hypothetical protein
VHVTVSSLDKIFGNRYSLRGLLRGDCDTVVIGGNIDIVVVSVPAKRERANDSEHHGRGRYGTNWNPRSFRRCVFVGSKHDDLHVRFGWLFVNPASD